MWSAGRLHLCGVYHRALTTPELVYRLCEAKFIGESAPSVGRRTVVLIVTAVRDKESGDVREYRHTALREKSVDEIRKVSESERLKVPEAGYNAANDAVENAMAVAWWH